jgi:hypothetical protein
MWTAKGHPPVDGVLALDPLALRAVLAATGPIDAGGRAISAENVVAYLVHDQYVEHAKDPQPSIRKEQLGRVAQAALQALQDRPWSITTLTKEIASAARGRHVLAWSKLPAENEAWVTAGIAGAMAPNSLLVAVDNRGANKLDQFLDVSVDLDIRDAGSRRSVAMTVRLHNRTPGGGEPAYILGIGEAGIAPGVYKGILSISLPTSAHGGRFDGVTELAAFGPDGPSNVVAVAFELARGADRSFVLRFTVPNGPLRVEPSARLPAVPWLAGSRHWDDASAFTLAV